MPLALIRTHFCDMRLKQCRRCGAAFETELQGAYLCPACAATSRRESVCRERVCVDCGCTFSGYPKSKRCPACQAEADRAASRRHKRNGAARHLGSVDICQSCGAEYIVTSGLQRYCKSCSASSVTANVREHKRDYTSDYRERNDRIKPDKICLVCVKTFAPGTAAVTCSPECAAARRKQLQRARDKKRSPRSRKT